MGSNKEKIYELLGQIEALIKDNETEDGAFSFANKVPGVFENAKNAEGFVKITELKPSHRTRVAASICEECKTVIFKY